MKTIQQDLKFSDLNMDDAVDLAQNRPLWRLMSTFGATHSWWCLPEMMMMMMIRYDLTCEILGCVVMCLYVHWLERPFLK